MRSGGGRSRCSARRQECRSSWCVNANVRQTFEPANSALTAGPSTTSPCPLVGSSHGGLEHVSRVPGDRRDGHAACPGNESSGVRRKRHVPAGASAQGGSAALRGGGAGGMFQASPEKFRGHRDPAPLHAERRVDSRLQCRRRGWLSCWGRGSGRVPGGAVLGDVPESRDHYARGLSTDVDRARADA